MQPSYAKASEGILLRACRAQSCEAPSGAKQDGGEGGIRTPETVARMPHFECGAFNHSATSPSPGEAFLAPYMGGGAISCEVCGHKRADAPAGRATRRQVRTTSSVESRNIVGEIPQHRRAYPATS